MSLTGRIKRKSDGRFDWGLDIRYRDQLSAEELDDEDAIEEYSELEKQIVKSIKDGQELTGLNKGRLKISRGIEVDFDTAAAALKAAFLDAGAVPSQNTDHKPVKNYFENDEKFFTITKKPLVSSEEDEAATVTALNAVFDAATGVSLTGRIVYKSWCGKYGWKLCERYKIKGDGYKAIRRWGEGLEVDYDTAAAALRAAFIAAENL